MKVASLPTNKERFNVLSWALLEFSAAHFRAHLIHPSWKTWLDIENWAFDILEDEFERLAERLGVEPTASRMVEFDDERATCRLVLHKLSKPVGTSIGGVQTRPTMILKRGRIQESS